MTLHLYAVVDADHPLPEGGGLRGRPLHTVCSADLAAVVSPLDETEATTDEDAIAHLDVLTALVSDGPVVAMRFGTTAPDDDAVRAEVLEPSQRFFEENLRARADVVEVLVSMFFDENAALGTVLRPGDRRRSSDEGDSVAERIALGERVAARLADRVRLWGERLLTPVTDHAEDVVVLDAPEYTAVRYALLVHRDEMTAVDAEMRVMPLAAEQGAVPCEIEYVGPLPPLDFPVEPTAEEGSSRWGW
jgi:hypothetical protein